MDRGERKRLQAQRAQRAELRERPRDTRTALEIKSNVPLRRPATSVPVEPRTMHAPIALSADLTEVLRSCVRALDSHATRIGELEQLTHDLAARLADTQSEYSELRATVAALTAAIEHATTDTIDATFDEDPNAGG